MSRRKNETGGVTRDAILDGRVTLLQPAKGPRAAIDAVFLAAAIPAQQGRGDTVLEAGMGTGAASLALAARVSDVRVTGIEIQDDLCAMAEESVRLNGLQDRVRVIQGDLMADTVPERESFAHVAANPPYFEMGKARASGNSSKAQAHLMKAGSFGDWAAFLARMAAPKGTVTVIHRAEALEDLLSALSPRFGALTVCALFPRENAPAHRVIVQGVKGSRAPLALLPGIVLHESDGSYTDAADAVLRGAALELARK